MPIPNTQPCNIFLCQCSQTILVFMASLLLFRYPLSSLIILILLLFKSCVYIKCQILSLWNPYMIPASNMDFAILNFLNTRKFQIFPWQVLHLYYVCLLDTHIVNVFLRLVIDDSKYLPNTCMLNDLLRFLHD